MKLVINRCYGGFSLSEGAQRAIAKRKGIEVKLYDYAFDRGIDRGDLDLIAVVEEMGPAANGSCAELKIVEISGGVRYEVEEYDGMEWIGEIHRTWC